MLKELIYHFVSVVSLCQGPPGLPGKQGFRGRGGQSGVLGEIGPTGPAGLPGPTVSGVATFNWVKSDSLKAIHLVITLFLLQGYDGSVGDPGRQGKDGPKVQYCNSLFVKGILYVLFHKSVI